MNKSFEHFKRIELIVIFISFKNVLVHSEILLIIRKL